MRHFSIGASLDVRIDRAAERMRRMGIETLEVCAPGLEISDAREIRSIADRYGFSVWSIHARYLDRESWPTIAPFEHDAKVAVELGAKIMVTHAPSRLADGGFDYERFYEGARTAEKYGLDMAVETVHFGNEAYSTTSYRDLIEIVDHINMKNVGINVDTGHAYIGDSHEVDRVIREVGQRLKTVHIHDNFGERDDHQPVGIGCINWEKTVKALIDSSYDGPFMLELSCGHEKRKLTRLLGYDMGDMQELAYSIAWLRYQWEELTAGGLTHG